MLIITIGTQRSGTKALGSCFKCGTEIVPLGEVFNPEYNTGYGFHEFVERMGIKNLIKLGPTEYLDYYFRELNITHGSFHIDLMFNQIEIPCLGWNPFSTHYIYGYLKSRSVPIIHLRRNPARTFISEKYLEIVGGPAHFCATAEAQEGVSVKSIDIDVSEFYDYRSQIYYSCSRLVDAMDNYSFYVELNYEEFKATNLIPENVINCIMRASELSNAGLKRDRIQLYKPDIVPSSIDYKSFFPKFYSQFCVELSD